MARCPLRATAEADWFCPAGAANFYGRPLCGASRLIDNGEWRMDNYAGCWLPVSGFYIISFSYWYLDLSTDRKPNTRLPMKMENGKCPRNIRSIINFTLYIIN
jgi:hypothetical protein